MVFLMTFLPWTCHLWSMRVEAAVPGGGGTCVRYRRARRRNALHFPPPVNPVVFLGRLPSVSSSSLPFSSVPVTQASSQAGCAAPRQLRQSLAGTNLRCKHARGLHS